MNTPTNPVRRTIRHDWVWISVELMKLGYPEEYFRQWWMPKVDDKDWEDFKAGRLSLSDDNRKLLNDLQELSGSRTFKFVLSRESAFFIKAMNINDPASTLTLLEMLPEENNVANRKWLATQFIDRDDNHFTMNKTKLGNKEKYKSTGDPLDLLERKLLNILVLEFLKVMKPHANFVYDPSIKGPVPTPVRPVMLARDVMPKFTKFCRLNNVHRSNLLQTLKPWVGLSESAIGKIFMRVHDDNHAFRNPITEEHVSVLVDVMEKWPKEELRKFPRASRSKKVTVQVEEARPSLSVEEYTRTFFGQPEGSTVTSGYPLDEAVTPAEEVPSIEDLIKGAGCSQLHEWMDQMKGFEYEPIEGIPDYEMVIDRAQHGKDAYDQVIKRAEKHLERRTVSRAAQVTCPTCSFKMHKDLWVAHIQNNHPEAAAAALAQLWGIQV